MSSFRVKEKKTDFRDSLWRQNELFSASSQQFLSWDRKDFGPNSTGAACAIKSTQAHDA
jgi:hypothetical protein